MRYSHRSLNTVKSVLTTRLSYIVSAAIRSGETQVGLADAYGIPARTISDIKLQKYTSFSLDRLLTVADKLKLDYTIIIKTVGGNTEISVMLPSYSENPTISSIAA